jgi:hypothetical protein
MVAATREAKSSSIPTSPHFPKIAPTPAPSARSKTWCEAGQADERSPDATVCRSGSGRCDALVGACRGHLWCGRPRPPRRRDTYLVGPSPAPGPRPRAARRVRRRVACTWRIPPFTGTPRSAVEQDRGQVTRCVTEIVSHVHAAQPFLTSLGPLRLGCPVLMAGSQGESRARRFAATPRRQGEGTATSTSSPSAPTHAGTSHQEPARLRWLRFAALAHSASTE